MGSVSSPRKIAENTSHPDVFRWGHKGQRIECGLDIWLRDEPGSFEKISYDGRVMRNTSAMTAEREALRMGIESLTVLFPTKVSLFDFKVGHSGRIVQYKLDAQSLRLFVLHSET